MAYTICDEYGDPKPIRMLLTNRQDVPYLGIAFTPDWWVCDPCNGPSARYQVTYRPDAPPQGYHWYQVVTSDDSDTDIQFKLDHYARVIEARKVADAARREYERLNS